MSNKLSPLKQAMPPEIDEDDTVDDGSNILLKRIEYNLRREKRYQEEIATFQGEVNRCTKIIERIHASNAILQGQIDTLKAIANFTPLEKEAA